MRVTIIVDDGTVAVDGRLFGGIDMTGHENVHAVQWHEDRGEIEFKFTGEGIKPRNMPIESLVAFQGLIDQWEAIRSATDSPVFTLSELKYRKGLQINAQRDSALVAPVMYAEVLFDADQRSRDNLTGAIAAFVAGVPVPEGFAWRSADNQNIPMDLAGLTGLAAAMLQQVNTAYAVSWARKAAVEAAESEAEVNAA